MPRTLQHPTRGELGQEVRAFQIRRDQLVEALFSGFEHVPALTRRDARVIDEEMQALGKNGAGMADQCGPVFGPGDVTPKDLAAGLRAQRFRMIAAAQVRCQDVVRGG